MNSFGAIITDTRHHHTALQHEALHRPVVTKPIGNVAVILRRQRVRIDCLCELDGGFNCDRASECRRTVFEDEEKTMVDVPYVFYGKRIVKTLRLGLIPS